MDGLREVLGLHAELEAEQATELLELLRIRRLRSLGMDERGLTGVVDRLQRVLLLRRRLRMLLSVVGEAVRVQCGVRLVEVGVSVPHRRLLLLSVVKSYWLAAAQLNPLCVTVGVDRGLLRDDSLHKHPLLVVALLLLSKRLQVGCLRFNTRLVGLQPSRPLQAKIRS